MNIVQGKLGCHMMCWTHDQRHFVLLQDLLDPDAEMPPPVQRRQSSFPKQNGDLTSKPGRSSSGLVKTPTVDAGDVLTAPSKHHHYARAERNSFAALEGFSPVATMSPYLLPACG